MIWLKHISSLEKPRALILVNNNDSFLSNLMTTATARGIRYSINRHLPTDNAVGDQRKYSILLLLLLNDLKTEVVVVVVVVILLAFIHLLT
jgi:hypothetical protein